MIDRRNVGTQAVYEHLLKLAGKYYHEARPEKPPFIISEQVKAVLRVMVEVLLANEIVG